MGFVLASSLPKVSSITSDGNHSRSKQCAKNYHASSNITNAWHKTGEIEKEYHVMMCSHGLKHRYNVNEEGSKYQEWDRKYVINATSGQSYDYESQAGDQKSTWNSVKDGLLAFYQFTRPYAATTLVFEATAISLLAVEKLSDLSLEYLNGWLQIVVAFALMSIVTMGLNQLSDVEIDKINKPHLPLASGALSFKTGVAIVVSSSILGQWFTWMIGSLPLFWTVLSNNLLAIAYSVDLPLLRWKKSPILTMIFATSNVAVIIPIGSFLHMQTYVFKRPAIFPRPLVLATTILSIFCVVITMIKDIPDMEGDEKFGFRSLAVRLGAKRVFWIGISLLNMAYGVAILVGATSTYLWCKISLVLGHAILALVLHYYAKSVDLKNNASVETFYMFIWKNVSSCIYLDKEATALLLI